MTTWEIVKRLFEPLTKLKKNVLILIIRGVYFGSMASLLNLCYKYAVDAISEGYWEGFVWGGVGILLFFIIKSFPGHFFRKHQFILDNEIQRILYIDYLSKYLHLDTNITEKLGTGKSNSIIQKGCDNRMEIIKKAPQYRTDNILTVIIGLITVFFTLGGVAGILTSIAVFIMIVVGYYGNIKVATYRKTKRDAYINADRTTVKLIMSKMEIMQSDNNQKELHKISEEFDTIKSARIEESRGFIWGFDIPRGIMDVIRISLFMYLGYGILHQQYTIGDLVLVWGLMKLIELSIRDINDFITDIMSRMIFVEKLRHLFDTSPQIQGYDTGANFEHKNGNIELHDITFTYDQHDTKSDISHPEIFHHFSLTLQGGKKTALVGASGSGKSTLVKLIAGYLRPDSGSVIIDDQDLTSISLKSYYQHIGYLTQEPSVFDGTIRENLEYGILSPSEDSKEEGVIESESIDEIISLAKCEWIYDLPNGLDTEIGERGIRLSGGQRQRLAIAKIMIKDPKIIILDEPTSALDSFAEEAITQAMHNLFAGRTVIIIAHRLQTVKAADDIIVIEQGHIIERGTHDELVQHGGSYVKMLELQAGF